tara:strand:- start:95 stop:751 length:657 start_codon:yes stop_codon:yes gene_type:complete
MRIPLAERFPLRVQPGSLWTSHTVANAPLLNELLAPSGMQAAQFRIFARDKPEMRCMFNLYDVRSPYMEGTRLEMVTLAKRKHSSKVHFVVLDCLSNALRWDPAAGIGLPNAAVRRRGDSVSMQGWGRHFRIATRESRRPQKTMSRRFAVDANYDCYHRASPRPLRLQFSSAQIMQPVTTLDVLSYDNTFGVEVAGELTHCFFHPHAMDFYARLSDFF